MILAGVLTMFLAFFVYLLMAGAGFQRALDVMLRSALAGLGVGVVMAALPYFFAANIGRVVFLHFAVLGCFTGLAMQSLRRAHEFVVPKSSTFEVVCLNVLVVAFGRPPDTVAFFEVFTELGYVLLVNPLGFWIPDELGWLKLLLSLWPSALALWAVSRGEEAGRLLRLFLMWWVQLICATWVFPASIQVLFNIGEGGGSRYFYIDLLLALVGLVRVLLTLLALRVSLWGSKNDDAYDIPEGTTAKSAFRRSLVDGMSVFQLPGWVYAAGGFSAYLLVNVMLHLLPPDVAITTGFFAILGVSSFTEAQRPRETSTSRAPATNALFAIALLSVGLLVLRELPLFPRHVRVVEQLPLPAEPPPPPPVQSTPEAPPVHEVYLHRWGLRTGTPLTCEIVNGDELQVRCGSESWPLESLSHPARHRAPVKVDAPFAMSRLRLQDLEAYCVEYPVIVPDTEPRSFLLLVFLSNASLPGQVGWATGPRAWCSNLSAVVFPETPHGAPTILFTGNKQANERANHDSQRVVTLQRHPQEEAALADFDLPSAEQEKLEAGSAAAAGEAPL